MQFTYTIDYDDDHIPWGTPQMIAEETAKINNHEWAAYTVTARAAGPVESEESLYGCVVPLTDVGAYHELGAIADTHLRSVAEDMAKRIEASYRDLLIAKRAEIDATIRQLSA